MVNILCAYNWSFLLSCNHVFTFPIVVDANFILICVRVSLMKNGEEVVSVGGALNPSNKNIGTSASNSIILDLMKVIKIFLRLCIKLSLTG